MKNNLENLYKKGSNESTPTALDNLILNAAKQSCEESTTTRRPKKWLYVLSTAAVLVMGISVVLNLQDQNAVMKVSPEKLDYSISQEGLRTKAVAAPPLEPHPKPQKKQKHVNPGTANRTGILGKVIAQKPITQKERDSSTPKIENEPQLALEEVFPAATAIKIKDMEEVSSDELSQISNEVVMKGMRRTAKPVPELKKENKLLTTPKEIEKLEILIMEKKYEKAQKLLEKLKRKYPNYDFSTYTILEVEENN